MSCIDKESKISLNHGSRPKPTLLPKPGTIKVVRALYAYNARTVDELTFEEGDILYVSEQSTDGWWKARVKGKTGLIPHNYVTEDSEVKEPLHDAVRRGNVDFLKECLGNGVSPTALDTMGNSPLYWAAHSGHLDCVQLLLGHIKVQVDVQNVMKDTPLHAAASRGHLNVVELLLSKKADATIKNVSGETAEDLAMDPAVKNVLHLSRQNRQSLPVRFDPEEYEDNSDE